jgi:hypothetical protein
MKRARTLSALFVAVLLGCGESPTTGPTKGPGPSLAFPTFSVPCGLGIVSTVYFVTGLSTHVPDAGAQPLEAVVHAGETVRLSLDFVGCHLGTFGTVVWTSTDASIAAVTRDPRYDSVAELSALTPGETTFFVDFKASDGARHRTYAAYCPRSQYGCLAPRRPIARVRVVAPPPPGP